MSLTGFRSLLVIPSVAALVTVGCGQGSPLSSNASPGTIVGPTMMTTDAANDVTTAATADAFGTLAKNGNGKGGPKTGDEDAGDESDSGDEKEKKAKGDAEGEDETLRGPNGKHGSISGFVTAVDGSTLTVRGIVVTVNEDTIIRHGGRTLLMLDIQVGDHVQVKGTSATSTTGTTTFTASEVKVEDMDHDGEDVEDVGDDDDPNEAKLAGKLSGLTGTCPSLTFNVITGTTTTTTTKVTTNADTKFDGVLCTALATDSVVEVKGTAQPDGSVVAAKVTLE